MQNIDIEDYKAPWRLHVYPGIESHDLAVEKSLAPLSRDIIIRALNDMLMIAGYIAAERFLLRSSIQKEKRPYKICKALL
ncbi:MAG: hypothetical protein NVSMB24_18320 [Mucilaginibacter sp.]